MTFHDDLSLYIAVNRFLYSLQLLPIGPLPERVPDEPDQVLGRASGQRLLNHVLQLPAGVQRRRPVRQLSAVYDRSP